VRLAADITPLRASRGFRWLYAGQVANMMGTQVAQVAVSLQVYALTRSSLAVGLVGLAALAPLIVFGLYGGSIADAIDRRLLVLITSTGSTATAALLLAQAVAHLDQVWLLYVCVAVLSAFFAVDNPTRRAAVPRLVGLPAVPAANTLLVTAYNLGIIGGPLVAGALVGAKGYVSVYALDTAAFVITVGAISRLPPIPPTDGGRRAGLSAVLEGLTYLRSRPVLLMAFAVDINAMVFGMPRALFPALAAGQFHSGPQVAGYLYAAPAVGALMVTVLGGWLPTIRRLGLAVLVAVAVWGAAITAFGLVRALWLALIMLAVAGAADSVSAVFRASILQLTTPDAMRGRMSGVYTIVVAGGPRLGDLEAGGVATAFTPTVSVVSGGLACLAGVALLALAVPAFARYHVPQSPQESPAPALLPVCSCLPVDTRRCRADDCRLNSERKIRGRSPMTDAPGASVRWNAGDAPDGAGRAKAVLAKAGRYHHGDLRAALIDTAIELITECGVHNFSLAEASRRLGVTVAAPYRHFVDRETLLAAVAVRGLEAFAAMLAADSLAADQAGPAVCPGDDVATERLAAMGRDYVRFAAEHRPLFDALFGAGIDKSRHPEVHKAEEPVKAAFACYVRELCPGDDVAAEILAETLADALLATAHGYAALLLDGAFGSGEDAVATASERAAGAILAIIEGRRVLRRRTDPTKGVT